MDKNASAYLNEENLSSLLSQNNFIVPEIQREYVWGENEGVITKFLYDLKNKIGAFINERNLSTTEKKINIGFLYSYKPVYVKLDHNRLLDENLIDGQQRFTTLFLLLFYCSLNETRADGKSRKEDFKTLIRFEEKKHMCFDFRVRDLTKRFMLELIEKVDSIDQIHNIENQTWFLKDYKNDVSIKSIRNALVYIHNIFSDNTMYYIHIMNYVFFWHFKTEATSQGEELYITMNARGEELADNEVTKAALMVDGSMIYKWGGKWEEWQQFFWKNRDKNDSNPSADKGLNGFLSCIAGLESYLNYDNWINAEKDIQKLLTLEKVEKYINAFKLLINSRRLFEKQYSYSDWIQKCFNDIWEIINKNETDWMVDYRDKNKSIERNRMVFIWSWLYYITEANRQDKSIQINEINRILRFFYIRYNNFNRSVSSLKKTLDLILINGIWDTLDNEMGNLDENPQEETDMKFRTSEETIKNTFLQRKSSGNDIYRIEELIWQIEDHPLNLDGSDVGNINITHLIDLNDSTTIKKLTDTRDTFFELFPNGTKSGLPLLKTILLHYGDFWKDTSIYYKRYDFSDWKRNIRKVEFKTFIVSLIGKTLDLHLNDLQNKFLTDHKTDIKNSIIALSAGYSMREKLIFYSFFIPSEELWSQGERVIICDEIEHSRLFKDENQIIYNSKGNFRGDRGNLDLWEKVNEQVVDPLNKLKIKII